MTSPGKLPPPAEACYNCTRHRYACDAAEGTGCSRCAREDRACVRVPPPPPPPGRVAYRPDCCARCRTTPDAAGCDASLALGLGCTRCRLRDAACSVVPGSRAGESGGGDGSGAVPLPPRPDGYTRAMCCDQCAWGPGDDGATVRSCSWRRGPAVRPPPAGPCRACARRSGCCTINGADPSAMAAAAAAGRFWPSHLLLTKTFPAARPPRQRERCANPREAPDGPAWTGPWGLQPENAWVGIRAAGGAHPPVAVAGPGIMASVSILLE